VTRNYLDNINWFLQFIHKSSTYNVPIPVPSKDILEVLAANYIPELAKEYEERTLSSGSKYEGQWSNGHMHGYGVLYSIVGFIYIGRFEYG